MLALALSLICAATDPLVDLVKEGQVATLSTTYGDVPFGSLVAYALDETGTPILFISDLAVHTKNLKKKSSCSIMIMKIDKEDVLNSARVTFVGKMEKLSGDDAKKMKKVFIAKHESAEILEDFEDFNVYRMKIEKIHYIGGFGDINWLKPEEYSERYTGKKATDSCKR